MAFRHKDVAVRRDDHIGRLVEEARGRTGDPCLSERHQNFPIRTEFENLRSLAILRLLVGDPEITLGINGGAMRKHEHPFAPAF
jgi:hypothetical protein